LTEELASDNIPCESATFDINAFLAEVAVTSVEKIGEKAYEEIKIRFLDKWKTQGFEKKFGFTVDIKTAKKIYEIGYDHSFEMLKNCIGKKHWALNFVKVGIYISQLSDKGERDIVDKIKEEVRKTKGYRPLNIVHMGSTGAIKGVISYLDELKGKGHLKESLIQEFERIIFEWEKITVFISKETNEGAVSGLIINKMKEGPTLFFVFSYGAMASAPAMCSIANLNKNNTIRENNYMFFTYPQYDGVGTEVYMWSFEKIFLSQIN
jgi:hypothetical protein